MRRRAPSPPLRPPRAALRTAVLAACVAACAHPIDRLAPRERPAPRRLCAGAAGTAGTARPCADSVDVTYLGVGGLLVRHGGRAIATAPNVTHRHWLPIFLNLSVRPDTLLLDRWLDSLRTVQPPADVEAVLVGHGHYDHLIDVPRAVARHWTGAQVFGSRTVKHLLAGAPGLDTTRVLAVDDSAGDARGAGRWIYTRARDFRVMPLRSGHAPNFLGYTIATGAQEAPRARLPRSARGYRMGPVYAYLVDVLDDRGRTVFRLFYQDAASPHAWTSLPPLPGGVAGTVDLAVVCVGNYAAHGVRDYPTALLDSLRPRHVLLGHWENFFRPATKPLRVVPFTDTDRLVRRVESAVGDSAWVTLRPFGVQRFLF